MHTFLKIRQFGIMHNMMNCVIEKNVRVMMLGIMHYYDEL